MNALLISIDKATATAEPVHAPVPGRGKPIKIIKIKSVLGKNGKPLSSTGILKRNNKLNRKTC